MGDDAADGVGSPVGWKSKEKNMKIDLVTTLEIGDADALHARAIEATAKSGVPFEPTDLGTADNPDLEACFWRIAQSEFPVGAGIRVDSTSVRAAGALRTIPMVAASISNLMPTEMDEIRTAFGMRPDGSTSLCLEDVQHRGLWMSPKYCGFYVRLPHGEEAWNRALLQMTPEMRAIAGMARAQGAWRIEFDSDEDPADGLPEFCE